jgi:hypothetical protein
MRAGGNREVTGRANPTYKSGVMTRPYGVQRSLHCSALFRRTDCAPQHNDHRFPPCICRRLAAAQQETTMQTIVLYNATVRRNMMRSA